jgi:hypothetical protein
MDSTSQVWHSPASSGGGSGIASPGGGGRSPAPQPSREDVQGHNAAVAGRNRLVA